MIKIAQARPHHLLPPMLRTNIFRATRLGTTLLGITRLETTRLGTTLLGITLLGTTLLTSSGCGVGEAACEDFIQTIVSAYERCGIDPGLTRLSLNDSMHCQDVKGVWDEDQLREVCFPLLEAIECPVLISGQFPDECQDQLLIFP